MSKNHSIKSSNASIVLGVYSSAKFILLSYIWTFPRQTKWSSVAIELILNTYRSLLWLILLFNWEIISRSISENNLKDEINSDYISDCNCFHTSKVIYGFNSSILKWVNFYLFWSRLFLSSFLSSSVILLFISRSSIICILLY